MAINEKLRSLWAGLVFTKWRWNNLVHQNTVDEFNAKHNNNPKCNDKAGGLEQFGKDISNLNAAYDLIIDKYRNMVFAVEAAANKGIYPDINSINILLNVGYQYITALNDIRVYVQDWVRDIKQKLSSMQNNVVATNLANHSIFSSAESSAEKFNKVKTLYTMAQEKIIEFDKLMAEVWDEVDHLHTHPEVSIVKQKEWIDSGSVQQLSKLVPGMP